MSSWLGEQIEERRESDKQILEESFREIASVVLGERTAQMLGDEQIITKQAIDEILKYYHRKPVDVPANIKKAENQLDYCLRHYGMMRRDVKLTEGWYEDSFGPLLGFRKEDGAVVALLPNAFSGYYYQDEQSGKRVKINKKTAKLFEADAICFYQPLPQKELRISDLLLYMKSCINVGDAVRIALATLAISLLGLLLPQASAALTGQILASGKERALIFAAIFIVCVLISTQFMRSVKGMLTQRLQLKTSVSVQSSVMMRMMSLPVSFFRKYSPGELQSRAMSVDELCKMLLGMIFDTGMTSICSLIYITQIFRFAPALVGASIIIILVTVGVSLATTFLQMGISIKKRKQNAKETGLTYSLITGVQKIKLAGAEKRVFAKWLNLYSQGARLAYDPPVFLKISSVINRAVTLFSTIILYYLAISSGVDQASYFAFTAAYGMVTVAFMQMSKIALDVAQVRSILEMAEPILKTMPEQEEEREIVTRISGRLEIDHVSFRYSEDTPYIIKNLSLKIKRGEYVAIVGRTGCGKSTLIRLLLGFENPEKGAVYYDGKDVKTLDVSSLRQNIGTVTQDGGLFQGDIYSNIVITNPDLTVDQAWEAAELAGVADDIRAMPMGMHTIISEGQGGISGGQKQRLMIARAIAPKPKLLIFDEATSALDNKTQKQVSDALDAMGCTRIVVAHRLSTIRHCDRILVLDGGEIIEDGTYEALIEKGGYFAELVDRQRVDNAG